MVIIDSQAHDLIEQYQAARSEESSSIMALYAYLQTSSRDPSTTRKLRQRMEDAHNRSMAVWDQLQPFRLDK